MVVFSRLVSRKISKLLNRNGTLNFEKKYICDEANQLLKIESIGSKTYALF